jgi:hypothetical protein
VAKRIVPRLMQDFPTQVCVHLTEKPDAPESQRLPLLILVSRRMRVAVVEGFPEYESLKDYIEGILRDASESATPTK